MPGEITTYGLENLAKSINTAYQTAIEYDGGLANYIMNGPAAIQVKHNWFDSAIGVSIVNASAASEMTITAPSGDVAGVEVGDYLYQKANGKGFAVASKTSTTVTLTALDGSATPVSGAFNVFIPSNIEGSESRRNVKKQALEKTNYTEIFERGVKISNSALASKSLDASTQIATQTEAAIQDLKNRLQNALYNGIPDDGSTSEPRHLGGLDYFTEIEIDANGGLTYAKICKLIKKVRSKGGRPNFIAVNTVHNETLNKIIFDNQRTTVDTTAIGVAANTFIDPISGAKLAIIYDDACPFGTLYVGELNKLDWAVLRPLSIEPLGKKGDNVELSIIQELTLEVHNGANCFGKLTGLTFSE
jgi:hypothetical protein